MLIAQVDGDLTAQRRAILLVRGVVIGSDLRLDLLHCFEGRLLVEARVLGPGVHRSNERVRAQVARWADGGIRSTVGLGEHGYGMGDCLIYPPQATEPLDGKLQRHEI